MQPQDASLQEPAPQTLTYTTGKSAENKPYTHAYTHAHAVIKAWAKMKGSRANHTWVRGTMGGSGYTKGILGRLAVSVHNTSLPETETHCKSTEEEVNMCKMLL